MKKSMGIILLAAITIMTISKVTLASETMSANKQENFESSEVQIVQKQDNKSEGTESFDNMQITEFDLTMEQSEIEAETEEKIDNTINDEWNQNLEQEQTQQNWENRQCPYYEEGVCNGDYECDYDHERHNGHNRHNRHNEHNRHGHHGW